MTPQTSTRTRNAARKALYKAMSSETDKDSRNHQLSASLGENAKAIDDNRKAAAKLAKTLELEQERFERALSKAKKPEDRDKITKTFERRGERLGVSFKPAPVKRLGGTDTSKNKLAKAGGTASGGITRNKHSVSDCGNLGCERCYPQYSLRRRNEDPKEHQLRLRGASPKAIKAAANNYQGV